MLKLSHLKEFPRKAAKALVPICAAAILMGSTSAFSENGSTAGVGIRLTIIPSTDSLTPTPQNPFSTVESALSSNQLYQLELNSALLADFSIASESGSDESPAELAERLEQAVDDILLEATSSVSNEPVILTVSAG